MHGDYRHLGPWLCEPTVQRVVVEFIQNAGQPVLCSEVAEGCSIPLTKAAKILNRLAMKRAVTRYKIPMQRRNRNGWATVPCWIYSMAEDGDA